MEIIRTYADAGRSGLTFRRRLSLQALIREVESKQADFESVLVYDVSRWGRFLDADESAYYEFLCTRANIKVHYCAETFVNDGSLTSTLLKTIKRTMASEYSRELSVKVFAGKSRLALLGFRQGGHAGYGLRRLLRDQHGNAKGLLKRGERKSIFTDRVILVPGPDEEVEVVREIYALYSEKRLSCDSIADLLNERAVPSEHGGPWTRSIVFNILTNPKYIGVNVSNRTSSKLSQSHERNPPKMWVRCNNAFEPLVSQEVFRKAQETLAARKRCFTDEELLELLRAMVKHVGFVSNRLINETLGMPSSNRYFERFNGLVKACELIGHPLPDNYSFVETNKQLLVRRTSLLDDLITDLTAVGASVQLSLATGLLTVNKEITVSFMLIRCRETKYRGHRWQFQFHLANRPDITIAARMSPANDVVMDYYILPGLAEVPSQIDLALSDNLMLDVYRFADLSFFKGIIRRTPIKENP